MTSSTHGVAAGLFAQVRWRKRYPFGTNGTRQIPRDAAEFERLAQPFGRSRPSRFSCPPLYFIRVPRGQSSQSMQWVHLLKYSERAALHNRRRQPRALCRTRRPSRKPNSLGGLSAITKATTPIAASAFDVVFMQQLVHVDAVHAGGAGGLGDVAGVFGEQRREVAALEFV